MALAGVAALASACVSSSTTPSAPTPLPQYAAIGPSSLGADNSGQLSGEQSLSLAATADPQTTQLAASAIAANSATPSTPSSNTSAMATVPTGPLPSSVPTPALRKPALSPTGAQPVATAMLQPETSNSQPATQPSQLETTAQAAAKNKKQASPAQKQSFFNRLFGSKRNRNRLIATDSNAATKTASLGASTVGGSTATARQTSANQLPGVKSNAQIFGIDDAETHNGETQVASLGSLGRLSPNGLRLQHDKVQVACLKPDILHLLAVIERHYGKKPIITSGYRSPKRNRRAGGAKNSMHIFCKAVDIQVEGVSKWDLAKYLRTMPGRGGVGTYCRTRSVHIDTGKVRDWHYPCRKSSKRRKKKA